MRFFQFQGLNYFTEVAREKQKMSRLLAPSGFSGVGLFEQSAMRGRKFQTPTSRYGKRVSQNSIPKISL